MLRLLPIAVLLALGVVLWCVLDAEPSRAVRGPWNRPLVDRAADPFPRTFVDPSGVPVTIPKAPERVVSGTIFSDAVLLEAAPPDRVRALLALSQDPRYSAVAQASRLFPRHVGGDPEEILAESPDLVIVSSFSRKQTRDLLNTNECAVVRFVGFSSVADIQSNIRGLGYVLGLDAACEKIVSEMQTELDAIAVDAERRAAWRVLLYLSGRTGGKATTFGDLLRFVGARNAADEMGLHDSLPIDAERVLALEPDALVLGAAPGEEAAVLERLRTVPGFTELRAVRKGRLVFVPNGWLLSTSHHAVKAARFIADTLDRWGKP